MSLNEGQIRPRPNNPLATISLIMSHIERCYSEKASNKEMDKGMAMEIFMTLTLNNQGLAEGILKPITMVK